MKLLFLYGPAAVGKLTVAKALSKLTDYPLFDNHLSIDYAAKLLEWNTPDYVKLLRGVRLFTFQKMAEIGQAGLIFTFVYTPPGSDEFIEQVQGLEGLEVLWVKLEAPRQTLLARVVAPERKELKKLSRPERLIQMLDEQRALEAIPRVANLTLDTSLNDPEAAAHLITNHYNLHKIR